MADKNQINVQLIEPITTGDMPVCVPGPDGSCSICGDEGLPGRVVELLADDMALVEMDAGTLEVAIDMIDEARVGDVLLVHLGFAIARVEDAP